MGVFHKIAVIVIVVGVIGLYFAYVDAQVEKKFAKIEASAPPRLSWEEHYRKSYQRDDVGDLISGRCDTER